MKSFPICSFRKPLVAAALLAAAPAAVAVADDWPTFRGADRDAVAEETGLLQQWPEQGPPLVWETRGAGRGYASLAIADGRIYTLGDGPSTAADDEEYVTCFDQSTGKPLWKTRTGTAWNEGRSNWQGSRSTPTVDGERLYVLTPHGELIAFDVEGNEQWRRNLKEEFGGEKADGWGYSESVLIDGERLICTPGGPENTMVALDKRTGQQIWSAARGEDRGAGHASAVISDVGGTKVYVQTTGSGPMGVRAEDGELLWTFDIERTTAVIPTPIIRDDLVFFAAGYRRGGALLRQVPESDGRIEVDVVYPLERKLSNKHGGIVLYGDYLYGDSDDQGIPYCADFMTGEIQWKARGSGSNSASVVAADRRLYIRYADGTMTLAKAASDEFEEVGHFEIPDNSGRPSWAHPVILDGKLYLREGDKIYCYDISA